MYDCSSFSSCLHLLRGLIILKNTLYCHGTIYGNDNKSFLVLVSSTVCFNACLRQAATNCLLVCCRRNVVSFPLAAEKVSVDLWLGSEKSLTPNYPGVIILGPDCFGHFMN